MDITDSREQRTAQDRRRRQLGIYGTLATIIIIGLAVWAVMMFHSPG